MRAFFEKNKAYVLGLLLAGLYLVGHWNTMNHLPMGVHNWAQADRYAVAKQYVDELDFFNARTYNITSEDGRCGVEFPLVQYVAARIAVVLGPTKLPVIFKGLNLLLLLGGFVAFMKQWNMHSKPASLFLGCSIFLSPILFFYGFNFLPDTAGLGVVLFAFAYFIKFQKHRRDRHLFKTILLAGFATLIKTSLGLYFIAFALVFAIDFSHKKHYKRLLQSAALWVVCAACIVLYDYYAFYKVNQAYWSPVFMSSSQPIDSLDDLRAVWKAIVFWFGQYMTIPQLLLLGGLALIGITGKYKMSESHRLGWLFVVVSFLGLLGFLRFMGMQFINHDYYFIASFMPLLFYLGYLLSHRVNGLFLKRLNWIPLVAFALTTGILSYADLNQRSSSLFTWKNRGIISDIEWLTNGAKELDNLGIDKTATLFVLYAPAPNTSLVYLDRKGKVFNHEEMTRTSDNMRYWRQRIKPDYYVVPARWNKHLNRDQPELYEDLILFAKRPNFYLYKAY